MSTGLGWWIWALQTPVNPEVKTEEVKSKCIHCLLCHFILRCTYAIHPMENRQTSGISRAGVTGRKGKKIISSGKLHEMVCFPFNFSQKANLLTQAHIQQERWPWHYFSCQACDSQNLCAAHCFGLRKGRCNLSAYPFSEMYIGLTAGWNQNSFVTLNLFFSPEIN